MFPAAASTLPKPVHEPWLLRVEWKTSPPPFTITWAPQPTGRSFGGSGVLSTVLS